MEIRKSGVIYFCNDTMAIVGGFENFRPVLDIPATIAGRPVMKIADYAFANTEILEAHLPNSITHIGKSAFQNCTQLFTVTFDKKSNQLLMNQKHLRIDELAFAGCKDLFDFMGEFKDVELGNRCFWDCANLYILNINIKDVQKEVFKECNNLSNISFANNPTIVEKSFDAANCIQVFHFVKDADLQGELLDYTLKNQIQIQCHHQSNLVDLIYQGVKIEIY